MPRELVLLLFAAGRWTHYDTGHIMIHLTIIPEISVVGSVYLKFDFQENRSHDSLQIRPMCCPETGDVQYDLSLYGCILLL